MPIKNVNECLKIISNAEKNRVVAFTKYYSYIYELNLFLSLNAHSSIIHDVLMVKLEKRYKYSAEQLESKNMLNK